MTPASSTAQALKPASPAQPALVPVAAAASPSIALTPLTPRPAVDHPLAAARSASPWPTTPAGPVAASDHHSVIVQPAPIPVGVVASARPAPAAPTWPPAFQTRDESRPYETRGIVYFDRPFDPARPITAAASAEKKLEPLKPSAAQPSVATPPAVAAPPPPTDLAAARADGLRARRERGRDSEPAEQDRPGEGARAGRRHGSKSDGKDPATIGDGPTDGAFANGGTSVAAGSQCRTEAYSPSQALLPSAPSLHRGRRDRHKITKGMRLRQ